MSAEKLEGRHLLAVQRAYLEFWTELGELLPNSIGWLESPFRVRFGDPGRIEIHTEQALSLRSVPGRKRNFDIYFQMLQIVEGSKYQVVKSNVRMLYLEARPPERIRRELASEVQKSHAFSGFHFDMSLEGKNHPVFHVQADYRCISESAAGRQYRVARNLKTSDEPRIPTAPIDLAGLVYVVLHDHFRPHVEHGWPAKLATLVAKLPRLPTERVFAHPRAQPMSCSSWYVHAGHHP